MSVSTYALSGVARAGATRANTHTCHVFVSIGGTEYAYNRASTAVRVLADTLTITDALNQTPNTCQFVTQGFQPTVGQDVLVRLGSINNGRRLFGGQILNVQQAYAVGPALSHWQVSAIDYTWGLDRIKVCKAYASTSATAIAQDLIATYASGYTSVNVAAGLPNVDAIAFTNQTLSQALTALAKYVGGYWYVDYAKDLHFFLTDTSVTAPTSLTSAHASLQSFGITRDLSQVVTRVYVEGGGVNALTAVAPGETILPVQDVSWYPASGAVAVGSQRLTYSGVVTGGPGGLVGPGAAPSVAPTLAAAAGSGLGTGVYQYAYTDVTAAGESLPSPMASVTSGTLAAPSSAPSGATQVASGLSEGAYKYAVTFLTALGGETTPGTQLSITTDKVANPLNAPTGIAPVSSASPWGAGTMTFKFAYSFVVSGGHKTALGPTASFTIHDGDSSLISASGVFPSDSRITYAAMYYSSDGGSTWFSMGSASFSSGASFTVQGYIGYGTGSAAPTNTAMYTKVSLSSIPLGPTGTSTRNVYRTAVGGSQLKLLTTLANNTTTTFDDITADASLGANAPSSNTADLKQVTISAIAVGPTGTTSRRVYRTTANGSQLKLLTTIADNTTTTYTDATADGSLGANVPWYDTSLLTQPSGTVFIGATSMPIAAPGAFNASGGWAVIGNGQQVIRYTGMSGSTLTGIPASGLGSIVANIAYSSTITVAAALTGIPSSGAGSVRYAIALGDPVNLLVQCDDAGAQATMAALVGGTGIIEDYLQDGRLSYAGALARGTAQLALLSATQQTVSYSCRDINSQSGALVTVSLAAPTSVSGSFLLQDVTISRFAPSLFPTFTVRASTMRYSYADLLRQALQKVS